MSKKGGKAAKEVSSYSTRDIVLGKVRGYPPWPAMVVDPDSVPGPVLKERPTTKKAQFYCVRFFPTGDYAWLVAKDISRLQNHEIQAYINEPFKKSGELLQGYRIALDPTKWEEEREAESRLAAEEEANAEVDQLDSENDGSGDLDEEDVKAKKTKKRKRDSDAAASASTKAKKAPKKSEPAKQKKSAATASGKSGKKNGTKKSNTMVESEEEDGDHVVDGPISSSKKGSPPPQKKQKRGDDDDDAKNDDPEALKVRDWRHKLQKTFLSHKGLPKDEDMPSIDTLFTTVEQYDKITIEYLQFSKIGKVMRHIAVLPDDKVPRNAEFKFKDRADALVKKWQQILNANKPANGTPTSAAPTSGAGIAKEDTMLSVLSTVPATQTQTQDSLMGVVPAAAGIDLNGKGADEAPAPTAPTDAPPAATEAPASQPEPPIGDVSAPAPVAVQDVNMNDVAHLVSNVVVVEVGRVERATSYRNYHSPCSSFSRCASFVDVAVGVSVQDMPSVNILFTTVEQYDGMTIEILQFSKIGKVMRHIAALPDERAPRNAELKFTERAAAMVEKWRQLLIANIPATRTTLLPTGTLPAGQPPVPGVSEGDTVNSGRSSTPSTHAQTQAQDPLMGIVTTAAGIDLNGGGGGDGGTEPPVTETPES
ncbi:hypothetical protein NP233_g10179 [Leucocoprinus birnbaumii]|uniref:PWWP domain-containing protein n=1 Tax=Leucocoprinus birnbaumii TaxID=56174 RepID=A0AAD5YME4_9AGAR|nr:hypothetical protein NP233_g10179 [Leucocoprinus birnbaumii]